MESTIPAVPTQAIEVSSALLFRLQYCCQAKRCLEGRQNSCHARYSSGSGFVGLWPNFTDHLNIVEKKPPLLPRTLVILQFHQSDDR